MDTQVNSTSERKSGCWRKRYGTILALLVAAAILLSGGRITQTPYAAGEFPPAAARPAEASKLRVASFNIHSGIGTDGTQDLDRTARVLKGFDVVGLCEVRGALLGDDQAQALGSKLSMMPLFAPTERQWWHDEFGNGLLMGLPAGRWERKPLAGTPGRGRRNLLVADVNFNGRMVRIMITHIDRQTDRAAQLKTVAEAFLSEKGAAVLMGDLNTRAEDEELTRLRGSKDVVDCLMRKAPKLPGENIDWIFAKGLRCNAAGLIESGASDHPMAWAEFEK